MKTKRFSQLRSQVLMAACAALFAGTLSSCSKEAPAGEEPLSGKWNVCIPAALDQNPDTRAVVYDENNDKLTAEFRRTDDIYVIKSNNIDPQALHPDNDGPRANLVGTLEGTYKEGDVLILAYNTKNDGSVSFADQEGGHIENSELNKFDYAMATVTVTEVSEGTVTTTPALFRSLQSMYKFTFVDKKGDLVKVTKLLVSTESGDLITASNVFGTAVNKGEVTIDIAFEVDGIANGVVWMALSKASTDADTFIFEAIDINNKAYMGTLDVAEGRIQNGKFYIATITLSESVQFAGGTGIEGDPWLIANPDQLLGMKLGLVSGETKYFKLISDIDMTGVKWDPLNNDETDGFTKRIVFDGDNHTISNLSVGDGAAYPSFAGVLNGTIKHVTFDDASINAGSLAEGGVVAGKVGHATGSVSGSLSNVRVKNSQVTGSGEGSVYLGGLAGHVESADGITLESCSAEDVTVSGGLYVGGLVGVVSLSSGEASIKYCYSTGKVAGEECVGGVLGFHEQGSLTLSECYSTGEVKADVAAGGLVGRIGGKDFTMEKCVAWNTAVSAKKYGETDLSSGAVVGVTFPTCSLTNIFRKPGMVTTMYWAPDTYNHPDVSASHPLVQRSGTAPDYTYAETTALSTASGQSGYPHFPYHGHYTEETSLTALVTALGWSSDHWRLDGTLPALKN